MKRFDTFGEYMFDLLFAPLKKGKQAANQLLIFCKVGGRIFDGMKEDVFRVREEANIASASYAMLPIHGQDREMARLPGETDEGFRTRLSMKGIIAAWAGTTEGIKYVLAALGYEHSRVEPLFLRDSERWAEFIIYLGPGNDHATKELPTIFTEVQREKPASSKLAYFFLDKEPFVGSLYFGPAVSSYTDELLNTADSIVLIRDREFNAPVSVGVVISAYSETTLIQADELILIQNRTFYPKLSLGPIISSYWEEYLP